MDDLYIWISQKWKIIAHALTSGATDFY